ncbi:MAG: serine hydrolase [Pseudomonadota bacterium]
MRILAASCLSAALVLSAPAPSVAQEGGQSEDMTRALAAGYKAAFTCSGVFTAGQSLAEIEANELTGVYSDYRTALRNVGRADIDSAAKTVSVSYHSSMPPRIAVWREGLGCAQLPIGATEDARQWLPGFTSWPKAQGQDVSTALGSNVTITANTAFFETLEIPISFAFDGQTYGSGNRTSAVVVTENGQVVAERYGRGVDAETPQRTWSVAKSITATVIGAAIEDGHLFLDQSALVEAFSAGGDPRREITLRNVLHMASGLDSGDKGSRTDRLYFGGQRVTDTALTTSLEVKPGSRFKYANNDTLIAMRALREALDDDGAYLRYPYEAVLQKIGATRTILETDWNGDYVSSSQVWATARDLARVGQLYLQDGVWGGERILPEGWVDFVSTPAPDQPDEGSYGYGAQFWLMTDEEGVPSDTFVAAGNRGQYIAIIPSRGLVIVRRGYDPVGGDGFDMAAFTRDVATALERPEGPVQVIDAEGYPVYDKDGNPVYEADKEADLKAELERAFGQPSE